MSKHEQGYTAGTGPGSSRRDYVYANRLNLDQIDVFIDGSGSDPMFLEIRNLPEVITYGKHYGLISIKDPQNSPYKLREGSTILFEFKDINGTVIFSELAISNEIQENYSGAAIFYVFQMNGHTNIIIDVHFQLKYEKTYQIPHQYFFKVHR